MPHFVTSFKTFKNFSFKNETNKSRKQTLESAQSGLEINFKQDKVTAQSSEVLNSV